MNLRLYIDPIIIPSLIFFDGLLTALIILKVPYTEIDWLTYMQQVQFFKEGERDYLMIRGDTGPLVYPAGHLYVYSLLSQFSIDDAQWVFGVLYLFTVFVVLQIYDRSMNKTSNMSYFRSRIAMLLCCLSRRIHSIYVLRLFNDGIAMLFLYISILMFVENKWKLGSALFSIAVSIKMNILLFAPGLFLLFLQAKNSFWFPIINLAICGTGQLVLGFPFLIRHPISYLRKAFEFDRVFAYKWTTNWKFLPENMFLSKTLSAALLVLHVTTLGIFAVKWIRRNKSKKKNHATAAILNPEYIVHTMFVSNFIGIAFARTLHYQFYSWYFHTIPFMLTQTKLPLFVVLMLFIGIELAFNIYPATPMSSAILQVCHFVMLLALYISPVPPTHLDQKSKSKSS